MVNLETIGEEEQVLTCHEFIKVKKSFHGLNGILADLAADVLTKKVSVEAASVEILLNKCHVR